MTMTLEAHATTTQYGTWVSYGGTARIVLTVVLLAAAAGVAYAGTRLPLPARPARPGPSAVLIMLVTWAFAILVFLFCVSVIVQQVHREHLAHAAPADPITPVTATCVGVIFVVLLISGSQGWRVTLASAAIAALAAPMIFEFPFDLIVMARLYPPIPPDPVLYRVLFFAPLFLIEVMTLSLLTLSPMVRLSRATFFWFALMLAVFAVWGLFGFAYPSAPVPFALNVLSKILAFVTALSLFLPQRARVRAAGPATSPSTTVTLTPSSPAGEAAALSSSASWSATRTAAGSGQGSI
jgi:hypothetical protein